MEDVKGRYDTITSPADPELYLSSLFVAVDGDCVDGSSVVAKSLDVKWRVSRPVVTRRDIISDRESLVKRL
jgi:hypothetical protein